MADQFEAEHDVECPISFDVCGDHMEIYYADIGGTYVFCYENLEFITYDTEIKYVTLVCQADQYDLQQIGDIISQVRELVGRVLPDITNIELYARVAF